MRKEWFDQLPVVAALCYSSQDEPDPMEAVHEALELITACSEVDPTISPESNLAVFTAENVTDSKKKAKK